MKHEEEKKVVSYKVIVTKCTCDKCKKEIKEHDYYYEVTTGHHEWGNDSCDSIEYKDYCSDECLRKAFDDFVKIRYRSKYMDIRKETFCLREWQD